MLTFVSKHFLYLQMIVRLKKDICVKLRYVTVPEK